jgi:hypothetical protein
MRYHNYRAYFHNSLCLDDVEVFDVPEKEGIKTGGMSKEKFLELVSSIEEKGLINPLVVEKRKVMKVQVGNNRVWALRQLGHTHAPAVIFARQFEAPANAQLIPSRFLESKMKKLHPGDNTWKITPVAKRLLSSTLQLEFSEE